MCSAYCLQETLPEVVVLTAASAKLVAGAFIRAGKRKWDLWRILLLGLAFMRILHLLIVAVVGNSPPCALEKTTRYWYCKTRFSYSGDGCIS